MIELVKGNTAVLRHTFYTDYDNLTVANLSGATITTTFKRSKNDLDGSAIFVKTIGSGVTVTGATTGEAETKILPTDTNSLPTAIIYWESVAKLASGDIVRSGVEELQILDNVLKTLP